MFHCHLPLAHLKETTGPWAAHTQPGTHLTPGDGGTDRCLRSRDEVGLTSMDLGNVTESTAGFGRPGVASVIWVLSRWFSAEAMIVQDLPTAVLGSRLDTVTAVTTPSGQLGRTLSGEGLAPRSPGGPVTYFLSGFGPEALPRCDSEAATADPSADTRETRSGRELPGWDFKSSCLAEGDIFCFLGPGSSSDGT